MRKFWLKDGGTEHSLQSEELFFYAPEGLGFAVGREYDDVENGFFAAGDGRMAQVEITGTLVFLKNAYEKYREIADFIVRAEHLQIVYCPYGTQKYYMDAHIDLMDKSEMRVGVLEAPIRICGLSPWRSKNQMRVVSSTETGTGIKRYGYRYPHRYNLTGSSGMARFQIAGHFEGGVEMRASGPLSAPVFTVKNADTGELYGKVDLSSASIGANEILQYSSLVNNAGIWREQNGRRNDLIDSVELIAGIPLFMRIPVDTWVVAELTSENGMDTAFEMTIHEYWKTR